VYFEEFTRIDEAFYREKQVQGWSRKKKEALINRNFEQLPLLAKAYRDIQVASSASATVLPCASTTVLPCASATVLPCASATVLPCASATVPPCASTSKTKVVEVLETTVSQIPTLRFKEFSDEWEVKKVEDIFSLFNGYAFSSYQSTKNGSLWVKIADVGIGKMKKDNLSYLPTGFIEKHKKVLLKEGDYVVALTRPILKGELKIAKIDKHFNNSLLNQRVGKLETKNNYDFVYFLLQKNKLISLIQDRIAGSDPPNLSPKEINSIKQLIPSLQEQQKIASFLTSIDKKTTQLQEKKTLLEQYKKGVMQQLFPSTGSGQVSELRFKPAPSEVEGKDDESNYADWEEKRLGKIGTTLNGLTGKTKVDFGRGKPYIQYKQIFDSSKVNTNDCGLIKIEKDENQTQIKYGDILFTTSSETPNEIGTASVLLDKIEEIYLNSFCFGFRVDLKILLPEFSQFLFRSNDFRKKMIPLAQGSTRYNISKSSFVKLKIKVPSIKEQIKIANFLSAIDTKIELVHTQLEDTQQFKKGLLQQLFV
jgi:type I restriction enzyme S subunit